MKRGVHSLAAILVLLYLVGARAALAQYGAIYDFEPNHGDPVHPTGTLRTDAKGSLFGAASDGIAYELKMAEHGGWTVKTTPSGPGGSKWILDGKGNYFTSVSDGGSASKGAILESQRVSGDHWVEKVIYSFGSYSTDGISPSGSLVFDVEGHLYGTTKSGGANSDGTVFQLTSNAGGKWTEKVLYNFGASSEDAASPQGLTIDSDGNLYGTTATGGPYYYNYFYNNYIQGGTVFQLTPQSNGEWSEQILHDFVPSTVNDFGYQTTTGDGWDPGPGLILDNKGNLYGTTNAGLTPYGSDGPSDTISEGTVFKLSPASNGQWSEQVLFLSCVNQSYCYPNSYLTLDSSGNLYGTTAGGGSNLGVPDGSGDTVFEVTSQWEQMFLYNFPSTRTDGHPSGGVILSQGNLFGVTSDGGPDANGTAYQIQNVANPTPVETTTTLEASQNTNLGTGEPITLTATVTSATGPKIPTGTVDFMDSAGGSVTELLVAGKAVYTSVFPSGPSYSVTARYSGGPGFAQSESVTITANARTTSQSLSFGYLPDETYGVRPLTLNANASSRLPVTYKSTGPVTLQGNILTIRGVGTVTVTASQAGDSTYAAAAPVTRSFAVKKAVLEVKGDNAIRNVGTVNPKFTYVVTGFVNGDTPAVIAGTVLETTPATINSTPGSYPITFGTADLTAANYKFTYVPGALAITAQQCQTIDYSNGFTATGLSLNQGVAIKGDQLQLTDGRLYEARSAFYKAPVLISEFTTDFNFQLLSAVSDGFTFTVQSNNAQIYGHSGGGLGYMGNGMVRRLQVRCGSMKASTGGLFHEGTCLRH